MRRLVPALIALGAIVLPSAAHAAPSVSGTLRYGANPDGSVARNKLAADVTVGEGDPVRRLELFPKISSGTAANPQTTAGGSCFPTDEHSGVICNFPDGLPPGTRATLTFDLPQDPDGYPANGGAQLTVRSDGLSPEQTHSIDLDGPDEPGGGGSARPPQGGADLSVVIDEAAAQRSISLPPLSSALHRQGTAYQAMLQVTVLVPNAGPDTADSPRVVLEPPSLPPGSASVYGTSSWLPLPVSTCRASEPVHRVAERVTVNCSFLQRSFRGGFALFYALSRPGRVAQFITVTSDTSDPQPGNNHVTLDMVVTDIPDANARPFSVIRSDDVPLFRGRATAASTVDVAIRRDRVRARGSAATCTWVRTVRSRFVRRSCTQPPWIRATGTSSWRLRFARPLPRGSYTLLARARRPGLTEIAFSARDRNLVKFRVR